MVDQQRSATEIARQRAQEKESVPADASIDTPVDAHEAALQRHASNPEVRAAMTKFMTTFNDPTKLAQEKNRAFVDFLRTNFEVAEREMPEMVPTREAAKTADRLVAKGASPFAAEVAAMTLHGTTGQKPANAGNLPVTPSGSRPPISGSTNAPARPATPATAPSTTQGRVRTPPD